jgi:hypothetical protein
VLTAEPAHKLRTLEAGAKDFVSGLTDAQTRQEEMFGEERLLRIIHQEAPSGSQALDRRFLKAIEEFTQGMPQTDDISFVVKLTNVSEHVVVAARNSSPGSSRYLRRIPGLPDAQ